MLKVAICDDNVISRKTTAIFNKSIIHSQNYIIRSILLHKWKNCGILNLLSKERGYI